MSTISQHPPGTPPPIAGTTTEPPGRLSLAEQLRELRAAGISATALGTIVLVVVYFSTDMSPFGLVTITGILHAAVANTLLVYAQLARGR